MAVLWRHRLAFLVSNFLDIDHLSRREKKKKCSPWKFDEKTTLKPLYSWAGEALDARTRGCLNNTSAQKWHSGIFKISAEKSFSTWWIYFLYILNESKGFAPCFLQITTSKTIQKVQELFLSSQETFFLQKFEKCQIVIFGQCNVETVSCPGIKGLSCSKVEGFEGCLFIHFSRAKFFVFMST